MNSSTKCPEGASSPEIDAVVHSFPQQSSVSAGEYGLKYGVLRSPRSRLDMKEYPKVYNTPEAKDSRTYA